MEHWGGSLYGTADEDDGWRGTVNGLVCRSSALSMYGWGEDGEEVGKRGWERGFYVLAAGTFMCIEEHFRVRGGKMYGIR